MVTTVLGGTSALTQRFTLPAPACNHRDTTGEATGLSQVTQHLNDNGKAMAHQDSVELRRDQH